MLMIWSHTNTHTICNASKLFVNRMEITAENNNKKNFRCRSTNGKNLRSFYANKICLNIRLQLCQSEKRRKNCARVKKKTRTHERDLLCLVCETTNHNCTHSRRSSVCTLSTRCVFVSETLRIRKTKKHLHSSAETDDCSRTVRTPNTMRAHLIRELFCFLFRVCLEFFGRSSQ